jgi:hypothetical protein
VKGKAKPQAKGGETAERKAPTARRDGRNLRHAHARGLLQGILSMLREGDVVNDCGANVGDVTAPLAATGATDHVTRVNLDWS